MGKAFLKGENGDHVLKMVQQLVPEMKCNWLQLVVAQAVKGFSQPQQGLKLPHGERPWWSVGIVVRLLTWGPPELWTRLPRLEQIRPTGPAKVSLSIFGSKEDDFEMVSSVPEIWARVS